MTRKSFVWTGVAAFSIAAVLLATLRAQRQLPARQPLPARGPIAWTPSYQMLRAAAAAGVLRN